MSTEIKSGASADKLTIDPVSKAARVTLYDSLGVEQGEVGELVFYLPIYIRQTAITVAGSIVWMMRNGATKTIEIKKLMLTVGFDAAAQASTSRSYSFARFSTDVPTGGTSILANIVKQSSTQAASTIAAARYADVGLTLGATVLEAPFATVEIPISATGVIVPLAIELDDKHLKLAANEGIAIYLEQNAAVGQSISGMIQWDEA